jgi:translation initiation factor IF-1
MVKNTTGGGHAKGMARKNVVQSGRTSAKLRLSTDPFEIYAVITKILGGGMCNVQCIDNKPRLCIIRGKFQGRGKRDNSLATGTWVLVGAREWEADKSLNTGSGSKKQVLNKCDLLEVYSESDKKNLRSSVNENWSALNFGDGASTAKDCAEDNVQFNADSSAFEHIQLMEALANRGETTVISLSTTEADADEEDINIDDI